MNVNQENGQTGKRISGFSKLSKRRKILWIVENFFKDPEGVMRELMSYWHSNEDQQKILDGFSENTISNFYLPYGVAPNFVVNGKTYCVPMVIEESSVVAAASRAAKFWMSKGGFRTEVLGVKKDGHVHFKWDGPKEILFKAFDDIRSQAIENSQDITRNMEKRGGGVLGVELLDFTHLEPYYYQIKASFNTCDSMGANFINTVLESYAGTLETYVKSNDAFAGYRDIRVIMAILSNYTPECIVRAEVRCSVEELGDYHKDIDAPEFARKFCEAIRIAHIDPYRAATHNKGIFNGVDAVIIATGNDFRAIEASGHSFAARDGQYKSLSNCRLEDGQFSFWMDIPMALGTVGGATTVHPMAKRSMELLEHPNAEELMQIVAATGLAQNFAAVSSLVTTGIQQGHMRMHLRNILNELQATDKETESITAYFKDKVISYAAVRSQLDKMRTENILH